MKNNEIQYNLFEIAIESSLGVLKEIEIYKENKNQQTEDLKYKLGGTEAKYDSIVEKMSQLLDKIGFTLFLFFCL